MSHKGKLQRGEFWWNKRGREDNLPIGVKNDRVKMADVNYFLENKKRSVPQKPVQTPTKEKEKV